MEKFNFPRQVFELVEQLPAAEQGAVYSALFAFVFHDEDRSASLSGMALAIFNLAMLAVKPQVLRARYRAKKKAQSAGSEEVCSAGSEEAGAKSEEASSAGSEEAEARSGAGDVPAGMRRYALVTDQGWKYVDLPADLPAGAAIF